MGDNGGASGGGSSTTQCTDASCAQQCTGADCGGGAAQQNNATAPSIPSGAQAIIDQQNKYNMFDENQTNFIDGVVVTPVSN